MAKSKASFSKKEKEKKRQKQREEKKERMEQRKANAAKGKSLDDMLAYVDEDGNISATPPDTAKKKEVKAEDIQIGVPRQEEAEEDAARKGVVSFFNESKGFGFINDLQSGERVFVHVNDLEESISENDRVTFELQKGPRGLIAVQVKKLKA